MGIKPTVKDIGRNVLYTPYPGAKPEVGSIHSFPISRPRMPPAVYVVYGPASSTPRMTYCAHLQWENGR